MGVQDPEESVGQLRELVVQPVVNTSGEEGDPFEQTGDVRVVHHIGREAQPAGDLWVRDGKLGGKPAQCIQLAIVVRQQFVRHRRMPRDQAIRL